MRATWTGSLQPWRYMSTKDCECGWAPDIHYSGATDTAPGRCASASLRSPWPWHHSGMDAGGASETTSAHDAHWASQRVAPENVP
jgi:hypothetical protein